LGIAAWMAELPFLTILPRVAAQVSTSAGGGAAISPIGLPGVAAASLGAMAVIGHVEPPTTPTVPPTRASTVPDAPSLSHAAPRPDGGSVLVPGSVAEATPPPAPTPPVQIAQGDQVDVTAGSLIAPSPVVIAPPDIDALGSPVVDEGNLAGNGPSAGVAGTVLGARTKGAVGEVVQTRGETVTDSGKGVIQELLGDIP
jgi:hypothetical protein